jgi:predicted nuclease of predicted toxin-antitoxin system
VKIVVDMSFSPLWVPTLQNAGLDAVHWSAIGKANARDNEILDWALANGHLVFTHDLDFGALLAHSRQPSPSVFLVRGPVNMPEQIGEAVCAALFEHRILLEQGALLVYDQGRSRLRLLPIGS